MDCCLVWKYVSIFNNNLHHPYIHLHSPGMHPNIAILTLLLGGEN